MGNALEASSYELQVPAGSTFVQLVGVAHPSPAKAAQFRSVDLVAGKEAVKAAVTAGASHFVYVSVAQPAPIVKVYQEVRAEVEALIRESGLNATILRPWYVLGPGHAWPYALAPVYWVTEQLPSTREGARRLGLVTIEQMLHALTQAAQSVRTGVRVLGVPEIRSLKSLQASRICLRCNARKPASFLMIGTMVIRITKAHARGTSVRIRYAMRC